jgi:hypothetical protein
VRTPFFLGAIALGAIGVGLVAWWAGGQSQPPALRSCRDAFADGAQTPNADIVRCNDVDGTVRLVTITHQPCQDGRVLNHAAYGWGMVGGTWTYFHSSEDQAGYEQGLFAAMTVCMPGYMTNGPPATAPVTAVPVQAAQTAAAGQH